MSRHSFLTPEVGAGRWVPGAIGQFSKPGRELQFQRETLSQRTHGSPALGSPANKSCLFGELQATDAISKRREQYLRNNTQAGLWPPTVHTQT